MKLAWSSITLKCLSYTRRALLCLLCFLLGVSGCETHSAGEQGSTGWGQAALVEELRIGELEGDDDYMIGRVAGFAVDSEGGIYVVDSQLKLVRKYDANGVFQRNIGRAGEGPGEYRQVLGIRCLPNGTVAVLTVPHRIILYAKDGSYLRDFRVESTLYTSRMLEYDTDNNVYIKATLGKPPRGGPQSLDRLAAGLRWIPRRFHAANFPVYTSIGVLS
jgi:hypothetical protein